MYIEPSGYLSKTLDEERGRKPGHAFQSQPSSSAFNDEDHGTGARPLTQLTLRIGKKQLTFKVKDVPPPPTSQEYPSGSGDWDWDNRPQQQHSEVTVLYPKHRCMQCTRVFKTVDELRSHNTEAHAYRPYTCNSCPRSFATKSEHSAHMRSHEHDRPHQCDFCFKRFRHRANLSQHVKLHATGSRHFCTICGKCHRTAEDLAKHTARCMALAESVSVSGGVVADGSGQQRDVDGRVLKYECAYCGKPFHYNRDKIIHERVHTGEKPYECGYCGRGFTQSQACESHIRTHTGEKPYKCPHASCGKTFRDSSALRKHESNHFPAILRVGRLKAEGVREGSSYADEGDEETERTASRVYRDGARAHLMSSSQMEMEEGELEEEVEEELVEEEGEIPMEDDEGYYM